MRTFCLFALVGLLGACGGEDRNFGTGAGAQGGTGGSDAAAGASGAGGTAGTAGASGTGGTTADAGPDADAAGDAPPIGEPGRPGFDIVTAGARLTSTNYTLILAVGEGPGGNGVMSSTNYRLGSGVIATTQP